MIKFFRNIRQNLIMENKTANYLKYAIGEIVLVMIGILLALQVNSWKEQRTLRMEEKSILEELNANLNTNISVLENYITNQLKEQSDIRNIIQQFENKSPYSDSMGMHLRNVRKGEYLSLVTSAFESLKSIGFDLVRSKELRSKIINLFNYDFEQNLKLISSITELNYQSTHEIFVKYLSYDDSNNERVIPNDYNLLLENKEFYNLLTYRIAGKNGAIDMGTQLLNETKNLQQEISKELNLKFND